MALSAAPMSGSTSPMTMAGTLAQLHAEQLAGITICQLTQPGAPLLYGGIPGMANMPTMGYSGGGVECGMMNAAIHQLAAHIRVPNYNSAGFTDAKLPDAQAGWEKAMTSCWRPWADPTTAPLRRYARIHAVGCPRTVRHRRRNHRDGLQGAQRH